MKKIVLYLKYKFWTSILYSYSEQVLWLTKFKNKNDSIKVILNTLLFMIKKNPPVNQNSNKGKTMIILRNWIFLYDNNYFSCKVTYNKEPQFRKHSKSLIEL